MPIVEIDQTQALPQRSSFDMPVEFDPTFSETFQATRSLDNVVDNATRTLAQSFKNYEPDPDYDVWSDLDGYEGYADRFNDVESREEVEDIKRRIDGELENKYIISQDGLLSSVGASVLNGVLDPINLIPVGGTAYKTYKQTGNILEGAARTAFVGATMMTGEELALQGMQETRTLGESVANVAGATLISGVLGGASRALSSRELVDLGKRVEEELTVPMRNEDSSVGAAQVIETTLEQETLKDAFGLEKALSFQDPVLRTLNSPSKETRMISEKLAETSLIKNKNTDGIASQVSVENMIKSYNLPKYRFFKEYDDIFREYRQARTKLGTRVQDMFGKARRDGKLTYREFGEQVVKAARRGDQHEIPEVARAAKTLRKEVFDPIYKRAVDAGLMEDGVQVKTAPSYVTRLWDRYSIEADLPRFNKINKEWLIKKRDKALVDLQEFQVKFAEGIKNKNQKILDDLEQLKWRASFEDAELSEIAGEITDRIIGTPVGRLPYDTKIDSKRSMPSGRAMPRGAARHRVYDIPDELVEDFLVNDMDAIVHSYTRSLGADIELKKIFGDLDLTDQYKRIQEDYAKLANKADAKTALKLKKAKDRDLRDLEAMVQRLRGTYGLPDDYAAFLPTAGRIAKSWNYLTLLGGMTLSALPDIARPVMVHGMGRVYKDGISAMARNFKAFRMAAEEVKEAGTALDMVLDTRAREMAELGDYQPIGNRVEDALGASSANFGLVSLMSPWNASMKQFSGVVTQSRILDAVNAKNLTKKDKERLAASFIDADMAKRIKAQFKEHGQTESGIKIANARLWDDAQAREAFRAAVRREVDTIIVTPGLDKPLWMSRAGLDLIGQFKSFAASSVQRTLLSGLQQRDMAVLNGMAVMTFLGMAVYGSKTKLADREVSDDWRVWLTEGIDRSGLTGWFFDVNNITEKVTRGRVGMNALVGGPPMSRYASRSALESAFGPTYGALGNAIQATGSAFAGDWKESDTHAVRKLMPYQNLLYIRRMLDEAEEGLNEKLGVN